MSELLSTNLRKEVHDLKHDPVRVMSRTLDLLESEFLDERAFVADPSQPLPFLIENDCILTAAAIEAYEANTLRQYPYLAQTEEELFLHVSDLDMVGMYALPSTGKFTLVFSKPELVRRAVQIDGSNSKKITIPKHTNIVVNNLVFTLQYPIDIVIKPYGGMEISYDASVPSPLHELESDRISWSELNLPSDVNDTSISTLIRMDIEVKQMQLTTHRIQANVTSVLKKVFTFRDHFYYARAYRLNNIGEWIEMPTTHSDHTLDPNEPTIKLKVLGDKLTVELPYIYQLNGFKSPTIRVDIYTTRGDLYTDLSGIPTSRFEASFIDHDNTDKGKYTAAMNVVDTISIMSDSNVTGGKNPPTFEERRASVINNNLGPVNKPISLNQLKNTVEKLGFDIMLNQDDILGRSFKVSRAMELNPNGSSVTPIDTTVMTAKGTFENLKKHSTINHHETSITVLPNTLYKDVDGNLVICDDSELDRVRTSSNEYVANILTSNKYLYTPLHYVIDLENNHLESRPYLLNRPRGDIKGYSFSNETIDLFIQTNLAFDIHYTSKGYEVLVETESNDLYKEVEKEKLFAQLAFKPDIESDWVFTNGVFMDKDDETGEWYVKFDIDTKWLINNKHQLATTNFKMKVNEQQTHYMNLNTECFIVWGVYDYYNPGIEASAIENYLGKHLLADGAIGIYREALNLKLGNHLLGLWRRSIPMASSIEYVSHEHDVFMKYESTIFDIDPETGSPIIDEDPETGELAVRVLHEEGDPILDDNGEPMILFHKGTPIINEYGEPTPKDYRSLEFWWDIVLLDARYRFATNRHDLNYAENIALTLDKWVNVNLLPIREMALERTEISFQPRNTLKYINVLVNDGVVESIYTAQSIVVDLFMNEESYNKTDVRYFIDKSIREIIAEILSRKQILKDDLIDAIRDELKEDVVTVKIRNLGGSENYDIITVLDDNSRLGLAKSLNLETDGKLVVKDNVTINYHKHSL